MEYVLLIHGNGEGYAALPAEEIDKLYAGHYEFMTALKEAGVGLPYSAELGHPASARIVRPAGGDWLLTDGPFTETKEQLGGFYVIDVPDMDTAVGWAKRIPVIPGDAVEMRAAKASGE
jgi:hypothetical protein